ncbi:MAG: hypothetical protein HY896_13275 [Deltaproteobacteria bacterium]|nr:hypothetical protein [Deltaproteobacteria bacterium]
MVGFLIGATVLLTAIFGIIQLLFLWSCQGAVETAAHFAARKFAINARADYRKARTAALAEAASLCRHRIGGNLQSAALTSLDIARDGNNAPAASSASASASTLPSAAAPGEAYKIRLTHGVELIVPWVDRVLYSIAPVPKTQIGGKYYLLLNATRWATVE